MKSTGFNSEYTITQDDKTYSIKEVYSANQSNETNSYNITISYNGNDYNYQTYKDYKKSSKIIKTIYSYNNCIYPVLMNNESYFDITCINNGVQEYYHNMKGKDSGLDEFATSLSSKGYKVSLFEDNEQFATYDRDKAISYKANNIVSDHYFAIVSYKGLYTMSVMIPNKIYTVSLFDKDVYEPNISAFINDYYVIADYDSGNAYNSAYIVNIKNNNIKSANFSNNISKSSYVQGMVGDSVYILDSDNSEQYEVNTIATSATEVGNSSTKFKYYDGSNWSYISLADSLSKKYFVTASTRTSDATYARIDTIGGSKTGFKYYYQYSNGIYKCYRQNVQSDILTHVFDTTSIEKLYYIDDYVYFLNGNNINYYKDNLGIRTLMSDSEINFNKYVKFYVHK